MFKIIWIILYEYSKPIIAKVADQYYWFALTYKLPNKSRVSGCGRTQENYSFCVVVPAIHVDNWNADKRYIFI